MRRKRISVYRLTRNPHSRMGSVHSVQTDRSAAAETLPRCLSGGQIGRWQPPRCRSCHGCRSCQLGLPGGRGQMPTEPQLGAVGLVAAGDTAPGARGGR